MAPYLGAIDQGTTSTRFIVFDHSGRIVSVAQKEHEQIFPSAAWIEHDPDEIWRRTQEVIEEAMRGLKSCAPRTLPPSGLPTNARLRSFGIARPEGRCTTPWSGRNSTRVDDAVAEFSQEGGQDRFREKTGLPLATYFSGLKIRWILKNIQGAQKAAEAGELLFGTVETFLSGS